MAESILRVKHWISAPREARTRKKVWRKMQVYMQVNVTSSEYIGEDERVR